MSEVFAAAERAVIAGDAPALERLLADHPQLAEDYGAPPYVPEGPGPHYSGTAEKIITREQQFEDFSEYLAFRELLRDPASATTQFEAAVEAIITGDLATLRALLRDHPELINARSVRRHHSTLLHYVGANGVEGFRQKTPPNAVEITKLLLAAGAEVDAPAGMYGGGSTTLGLVATSIHPWLAGLQNPIMDVLLQHGARLGGVRGCLANGRGAAAEFLADRGAALDLEEAAGVGRLEVVQSFFDEQGDLIRGATRKQLIAGFAWACEFGRTAVVDYLLQHGVAIDARLPHDGQTGLHWAALGGHTSTVELLLSRGAPINLKDPTHDGTPLGWALYGWSGSRPPGEQPDYYAVVSRLVAAGATVDPNWLSEDDRGLPLARRVREDPRMQAALEGKS